MEYSTVVVIRGAVVKMKLTIGNFSHLACPSFDFVAGSHLVWQTEFISNLQNLFTPGFVLLFGLNYGYEPNFHGQKFRTFEPAFYLRSYH